MRLAVLDTYYEAFRSSFQLNQSVPYQEELDRILRFGFATADFYSHNLRTLGHEVVDIITDWPELQNMWARENGNPSDILAAQLAAFKPDCVFQQDLSVSAPKGDWLRAGQISCALPSRDLRVFDCLFSSFPFYVERFNSMGIKAVYLPLAFDPRMLEERQPERDIDVSFVGGLGDSHWQSGTDTLEAVAAAFGERFQWWGYGLERLPASSALRACYKGAAFGRDMYSIYRRSKIVINRHGEVAQGFANNLRMYEATGCGAMLLTDNQTNLFAYGEICQYSDAAMATEMLHYYLDDMDNGKDRRSEIAKRGQASTLRDHTYKNRMQVVSDTLQEMLCHA